jgi:putative DNA primase/helicase
VSNGSSPFPDGTAAPRGQVVILGTEDGVADTIVPRLIGAGADMDYIHIVRGTSDRGWVRQLGTASTLRIKCRRMIEVKGAPSFVASPSLSPGRGPPGDKSGHVYVHGGHTVVSSVSGADRQT